MYIDSANLAEIEELKVLGIFKGVTTNPTLLLREKKERVHQLNAILSLEVGQLFVQLEGESAEEIYADFIYLNDHLIDVEEVAYKIPINSPGIMAINKIKTLHSNVEILGTAIYSTEQMILASLAGCSFVAPYINRMQDQGINPYEVVASAKNFLNNRSEKCKIMGASFKNSQQVIQVFNAGIDTVTLSKAVIYQMLNRNLAQEAIQTFNQHGYELKEQTYRS